MAGRPRWRSLTRTRSRARLHPHEEGSMSTKPVPAGYHTITPQLAIDGAAKAIEFYKKAFGAEVLDQAPDPSGTKVWHASLRIGDSMLFVNDVFPDMGGEH